ncbi:MAG: hypothetical protein PVJ67_06600 [Candidatus Pacearchaeota archaeon]|jgi:uncharacterized membrane protein
MSAFPWILVSVGILIILLLVLAVIFKKGQKHRTDYFAFFVIGLIWLPFGIVFQILAPENFIGMMFIFLGLAYIILGLSHKKDWKKNQKCWKQLSKKERKIKLILTIISGILVLLGLVAYYIFRG